MAKKPGSREPNPNRTIDAMIIHRCVEGVHAMPSSWPVPMEMQQHGGRTKVGALPDAEKRDPPPDPVRFDLQSNLEATIESLTSAPFAPR
jgi:hypothetical protein